MQFNWFDQRGEFPEKFIDLLGRKPVDEAMFWPLQDIFVFQEKRRSRQEDKPPLSDEPQDGVSGA
jgi:hypothetical protein